MQIHLHPVASRLLASIDAHDREGIAAVFAKGAALTDDGQSFALMAWVDAELLDSHGRLAVRESADDGLILIGDFRSNRWSLKTRWRITLSGDRISRLDVEAI
jgi:hypothetical protein